MRLLLCLAVLASPAIAAENEVRRETVAVGEVIERDVGIAIGVICDGDFVVADMATRGDRNFVIFRGNREGTTTCRVGTDPTRISYLYEVTVTPAKR